jgi:hypothetical protein
MQDGPLKTTNIQGVLLEIVCVSARCFRDLPTQISQKTIR